MTKDRGPIWSNQPIEPCAYCDGPHDSRPAEYAEADPLCCAYKTCGHGCEEDDLCSCCCGRGDCGEGVQNA